MCYNVETQNKRNSAKNKPTIYKQGKGSHFDTSLDNES